MPLRFLRRLPLIAAVFFAVHCGKGKPEPENTAGGPGPSGSASCGNGAQDPGEECDLGAANGTGAGCGSDCKTSAPPSCGNGVREGSEQCDDGNKVNLDGCDAQCAFEQVHRVTYMQLQGAPPTGCSANKFGGAFSNFARSGIQQLLDQGIQSGEMSLLIKFFDMADLSGGDDSSVRLGTFNATVDANASYSGTSDLDWWYHPDPASLDADKNPTTEVPAQIAAGVLTAGPGLVAFSAPMSPTSTMELRISQAQLRAKVGTATAPTQSTNGSPPGHPSTLNLDPALKTFAALGSPSAQGAGSLCGNMSASSLAGVPVLQGLQGATCTQGYGSTNSMLDVIVGGCNTAFGVLVSPSQPDEVDTSVTIAGHVGPFTLTAEATSRKVNGCKDKDGKKVVDLATCLRAAAYSSAYSVATGRVIAR